jgi:hypothetical protein
MVAKETKTEPELVALIMTQIRKYPEYNHIDGVKITRQRQRTPDDPNWVYQWSTSGNKMAPQAASNIAERLRARINLV